MQIFFEMLKKKQIGDNDGLYLLNNGEAQYR